MYGRQTEIQRIQSKLQRIGKTNPHRSSAIESDNAEHIPARTPGDQELLASSSEHQSNQKTSSPDNNQELAAPIKRPDSVAHTHARSGPIRESVTVGARPENQQHEGLYREDHQTSGLTSDYNDRMKPWEPEATGERSFVTTRDRYNSPAGKQALQEMGKAADLSKPIPEAITFFPKRPWPQQIHQVNHDVKKNVHQLADTLRQQGNATFPAPIPGASYENLYDSWQGAHQATRETPERLWQTALSVFKPNPRFTVPQGLAWFSGAMIVRMGIDRLLVHFPSLWIVMAAIVLTPVAIALYQTAVNPQSTVHSGRRLLVIMIGLLIGGQL